MGAGAGENYANFGLVEPQTAEDISNLIGFAKEVEAPYVVHSPAKIVQPRGGKLSDTMRAMRLVYEYVAAPHRLIWRGGSWRLPPDVEKAMVTGPFLDVCGCLGVAAKYCKHNLIETP